MSINKKNKEYSFSTNKKFWFTRLGYIIFFFSDMMLSKFKNDRTPPNRVPSDAMQLIDNYKDGGVIPTAEFGDPHSLIIELEHVKLHKEQINKFGNILCVYRNSYLILFQRSFAKETVPVFLEPMDVHLIANLLSALILNTDSKKIGFHLSDFKWMAKRSARPFEDAAQCLQNV